MQAARIRICIICVALLGAAGSLLGGARPAMAAADSVIEGYADQVSVSPGGSLNLYISSPQPSYTITFLHYGPSSGPVTMATLSRSDGVVQSYDGVNAYQNGAQWSNPVPYTIGSTWPSGLYAAQLTTSGSTFSISFAVRGQQSPTRRLAVLASTNTWTAYNDWGGGSFYSSPPGQFYSTFLKTSYLRPNPHASPISAADGGDDHLTAGEVRIIEWLEQNSYAYSVLTDTDLNDNPGLLDTSQYYALVVSTHSEYWSEPAYDAVSKFLLHGGSILSLSGNTAFRTVNLTTGAGGTGSTFVNKMHDRDSLPQARLLGLAGNSSGTGRTCYPYATVQPSHWLLGGTGLASGQQFGAEGAPVLGAGGCSGNPSGVPNGASGWETDQFFAVLSREQDLVAEGTNPVIPGCTSCPTVADLVYYRRQDGGQVVAVGSITFGQSLVVDSTLGAIVRNALSDFATFSDSGQTVFGGIVATGDWNGDGHPDLVARKPDGTLWLYPGDGRGGFLTPSQIGNGWDEFDQIIAPGDWNGDGHPDLIARKPDGTLWLYPGDGRGGFLAPSQIGDGWNQFDQIVGPGDWNGDGHPDLIARKPDGTLCLYAGDGRGGFVTGSCQVIGSGWDRFDEIIGAGDWNGDGLPDLIARTPSGYLYLYEGDGHGGFSYPYPQIGNGWDVFDTIVGKGDWNGDGKTDLLARRANGTLWLYPGNGTGGFLSPSQIGNGWAEFS